MLDAWKEILMFHFKVIFYYGICLEQLNNTTKYVQPNFDVLLTVHLSIILAIN